MYTELINAINASNRSGARNALDGLLERGRDPWQIHEALFPAVYRVLNPPFINPHLPKMYGINRELVRYLDPEDVSLLVRLEVAEYSRRNKLQLIGRPDLIPAAMDFAEVQKSIRAEDIRATAMGLNALLAISGPTPLAKQLLLLGSRYLDQSLGHSISCTAFMLLEMMHRRDQDPWPVMVSIAEYYCEGNFHQSPRMQYSAISDYPEVYLTDVKRAVSTTGIVALHHTITLYAIERSRHLFDHQEYDHVLTMWSNMLGDKEENLHSVEEFSQEPLPDFDTFYEIFVGSNPNLVLNMVRTSLESEAERVRLGRFLTKGVLKRYDGQYNPHCMTGLGSSLWLLEEFHDTPVVVLNGLMQYLRFFFADVGRVSTE